MKTKDLLSAILLLSALVSTEAATRFVDANSITPAPPFTDWNAAANTIQDAIDVCMDGDFILVTNGVYNTGGHSLTTNVANRVFVSKPITIQSVNGPTVTFIEGSRGIASESATRCVYLCNGAIINGFTLTNGTSAPHPFGDLTGDRSGGGIWCETTNSFVINCTIISNVSFGWGSAAYSGTLVDCRIMSNNVYTSAGGGGAIAFSVAKGCIISDSIDQSLGGGARNCTLTNCVLTANAPWAAYSCVVFDSLIYSNKGSGLQGGTATGCSISGNYGSGLSSLGPGGGATGTILSNCFIFNNRSYSGGGTFNCPMDFCVLSNNFATNSGGGAYWQTSIPVSTNIGNGNVLIANTAGVNGGGLYLGLNSSTYSFTNWTVTGNSSTNNGGGIYIGSGTLNLASTVLSSNETLGNGGGIYNNGTVAIATSCSFSNNFAVLNGGATYGVQVQNCFLFNNSAISSGGGIYGPAGVLMTNSVFVGNSAFAGGAAFMSGGGIGFSNCVFQANHASSNGGAVNLPYIAKIWKTSFTSNQAAVGGGAFGGTFTDCTFTGNLATNSGGAVYQTGSTTSSNCVFTINQCFTNGGAVYSGTWSNCLFAGNNAGQNGGGGYNCSIQNSILTGNSALLGGGVYFGALTQCLLTRNRAQIGGAVHNSNNYPIKNCTIVDNFATNSAGGIFGNGNATASSSIIFFNTASSSNNYSFLIPSACCLFPWTGASTSISNAPSFVDFANGNFRLQANSPCIDIGIGSPAAQDLDGRPRVVGAKIDIGAYEFQSAGIGEFIGWLEQNGLPASGSADFIDTDSDLMTNWQEWIAGTNPTNSESVLMMLSPVYSGSGMTISWKSVDDRNYFLERASDLSSPTPFSLIQSNISGIAGITVFSDLTATNLSTYFYRVGVQ